MPKKGCKNAFMCFVSDFKEDQKKKGIIYNKINEAVNAADPVWRGLSQSEKAKYEAMAQKQKTKGRQGEKYTSTGIPISVIEKAEREVRENQELERKDIKNLVNSRVVNNSLITMDIYLMDVNSYCKVDQNYIVGECTLLRFNIRDGIKETYHEVINPGCAPEGYAYDMKMGAEELGLDLPDFDEPAPKTNYMQLLANIIDYLKLQDRDSSVLPPVFALPEKVPQVDNFIWQLCQWAGEDETLFRVYRLDTLLFTVMSALATTPEEGLPRESLATMHLRRDLFRYSPGIACDAHEARALSPHCSQSRARRAAYSVLDLAARAAGVRPQPARHLPPDHHLPAIEALRDTRARRAQVATAAALDSSLAESVESASRSFASLDVSKSETVHVPQRMPKTDYSRRIRIAPELTEEDFPALSASSRPPGVSHTRGAHSTRGVPRGGRGRGLGASSAQ